MANRAPLVVGVGEILWDMLPAGRQLGGAPGNFAYHAVALGAQGAIVSRVGADPLGREILQRLDDLHVDHQFVTVDEMHPTGTVEVRLDGAGVAEYVIHTGVAWDFIPCDARLLEWTAGADAVCFGTLGQRSAGSRESIAQIVAATRRPCLRVFDINLRQSYFSRELVENLLGMTDVLKLNDQEMPIVAKLLELPGGDGLAISRQIMRRFPVALVALTRGGNGSALFGRDGQTDAHAGFPGTVVDTVGAGDAFTAALVMGLLQGHGLPRINAFANRLAAYVCSASGATPAIPQSLTDLRLARSPHEA